MTVKCENCGAEMLAEHGIIHFNEQTGVTWWKCSNPDCGRKVKQEYEIQDTIIPVSVSEVVEPW